MLSESLNVETPCLSPKGMSQWFFHVHMEQMLENHKKKLMDNVNLEIDRYNRAISQMVAHQMVWQDGATPTTPSPDDLSGDCCKISADQAVASNSASTQGAEEVLQDNQASGECKGDHGPVGKHCQAHKKEMLQDVQNPSELQNDTDVTDVTTHEEVVQSSQQSEKEAADDEAVQNEQESAEAAKAIGGGKSATSCHHKKNVLKRHQTSLNDSTTLQRVVHGHAFEGVSALLILSYIGLMGAQIQYKGYEAGYLLQMSGFSEPATQVWPHGRTTLDVLDFAFQVLFLIELLLRIAAFRMEAFKSLWVLFDIVLVAFGWVSAFGRFPSNIDPMIVRVLRLLRIAHVVRAFKDMTYFDTCFLLLKSIQASAGAFIWTLILLLFIQFAAATGFCQILDDFINDETKPIDDRQKVFEYFGTYTNAALTMFEVTQANWVPSCRLLYSSVGKSYAWLFVVYRCMFMFAILKIITAVFLAETNRCVSSDTELAITKAKRQQELYRSKLSAIFAELDDSGDGMLSKDEFEQLMNDNYLRTVLAIIGIDTRDLHKLFHILDNGDGQFSTEEFFEGLSHVRGAAKSIDILELQFSFGVFRDTMDRIGQRVDQMSEQVSQFSESLAGVLAI